MSSAGEPPLEYMLPLSGHCISIAAFKICIFGGFFPSIAMADEVKKSVHRWKHNAEKTFLDMPENITNSKPIGATTSDTERCISRVTRESNCCYVCIFQVLGRINISSHWMMMVMAK